MPTAWLFEKTRMHHILLSLTLAAIKILEDNFVHILSWQLTIVNNNKIILKTFSSTQFLSSHFVRNLKRIVFAVSAGCRVRGSSSHNLVEKQPSTLNIGGSLDIGYNVIISVLAPDVIQPSSTSPAAVFAIILATSDIDR